MPNVHPIACGCKACRGPQPTVRNRAFWLLTAVALVLATIAALL